MEPSRDQDLTQLLRLWSEGDRAALDELAPIVHAELHRIARRHMARERGGHTLQTTALVNEAFVRLIDWKNAKWNNRAHFFGVAAGMMRRILVDFARKRPKKDGTALIRVSIGNAEAMADDGDPEILALDDALKTLAEFDERKARIVELRFFGGLSVDETAEVLSVAPITVMREWKKAKAWLYLELNRDN
ncbi:MAG: sigma-70 family RNA polymerase sigma factor [Acidobacteriota bacterium]|nr:MAG: sigma-70 family RNA polymerase sigma factor [Acidobacteriota bacterium]